MKKNDMIATINTLIADNADIDFDQVPEDTKMKVSDLKDLLADVEDAVAEAAQPPVVKIADLAREVERDPKTVRAQLRRMYQKDDAADLPQPVEGAKQRWTFHEDDREAVLEMITVG